MMEWLRKIKCIQEHACSTNNAIIRLANTRETSHPGDSACKGAKLFKVPLIS